MKTSRKIDATEALRRVRLITPMIREDVGTAALSHVVLKAANDTIPKGLTGLVTPFCNTYLAGQNALSLKLAMDMARIFDLSEGKRAYPPEEQNKASIPVLAALLGRSDVQEGLVQDAGQWVSRNISVGSAPPGVLEVDNDLESLKVGYRSRFCEGCRKTIADFLALAQRLEVKDSVEKAALARIREFRNSRLAHSLFDKEPDALPKYSDLDLLLDTAKKAAQYASLAVEGRNTDFDDLAQDDRRSADDYYACVLDGLKRAARGSQ